MRHILIFLLIFLVTISAIAQQAGSKVSFVAADGKTYTGVIEEIKGNQYKVKYDGYNFEAWLTAGSFTVLETSVEDGYKVWVKTSPCSGRYDWISVAKVNPAYGGGGGAWVTADLVLITTGMSCTRINSSCSYAAAMAEANILRTSDKFFSYCCKDYWVYENVQTGKRTIVLGSGSPGFGWTPKGGPFCCEEAETVAGIPGACSGTTQQNGCWPGSYPVANKQTGQTECYCYPGLVWNSTKTACIDTQQLVKNSDCSGYPGSYAVWNSQTQRVECHCPAGKKWNDNMTACIDDVSQVTCWPGSHAEWNAQTQRTECFCNPGLVWNTTKTACVDPQELVKNSDCSGYPGSYAVWNSQTNRVECQCPQGKKWNADMTACIDDETTTQVTCWPGSHPQLDPNTQKVQCYCDPGLVWNSTKTACVDPQELVKNSDCSKYPGSYAVWNNQTQRVECQCPQGKKWNATMTACIDNTDNGNSSTTNPNGPVDYTCSATDQSEYAKVTGNWKSSTMLLTISGSCENVSGNFTVIEWCDGLNWESTKDVPRIIGTIKGSMHGKYLRVHYKSPPSPHNSKGTEGDGSCYLQPDGSLTCDFGCSGDLKR